MEESKKEYIGANKSLKEKMEEDRKMMEEINKNAKMIIENFGNVESIIFGEVKEWGNSAHIPFQKKYIGKKVKVHILKKEEDET